MDPLAGFHIYCSVHQTLKRPPSLESFSIVSCQHWLVEREATVMAPIPACDSALTPCLHGGQDFLQRHFPLWYPSSCPSGCLLTVSSGPCPGITLQSLWSSSSCHVEPKPLKEVQLVLSISTEVAWMRYHSLLWCQDNFKQWLINWNYRDVTERMVKNRRY